MKRFGYIGLAIMLLLALLMPAEPVMTQAAAAKKLKKPQVTFTATAKEITLKWNPVDGAKRYIVQKKTGDGYKTIGKTKETEFTDPDVYSGEKYLYRVRAYRKKSGKKIYSAWKKITASPEDADIKYVTREKFEEMAGGIEELIDTIRSQFTQVRKDTKFIQGETYTGTAYYISNDGDDENDGKSIDTPWKTLERLNKDQYGTLQPGDAVFFRRGDTFRGSIDCVEGVTYAAYGSGKKPVITGSPENGADSSKWILLGNTSDGGKVWEFYRDITDCGNLYFDDLPLAMHKLYPHRKDGRFITGDRAFDPLKDLKNDLDFVSFADSKLPSDMTGFVDVGGGTRDHSIGKLYLRCDKGNPGEVFSDIEFATTPDGISPIINIQADDITVLDLNICMSGQCGFSLDMPGKRYLIRGCEVSLCGGYTCYYRDGVSEPAGDGAVVNASNGVFEYNYFHDNGGQGITVECGYMGQKNAIEGIHIVNCAFERHASGAIQFVCFGQDLSEPTVFKDMEVDHNYIYESVLDCWSYPTMWHQDYGVGIPSGECLVTGQGPIPLVSEGFSIHDNIMYSRDGGVIFGALHGKPYKMYRNNTFLLPEIDHQMAVLTLDGVDCDWYWFNGNDLDAEVLMNETIGCDNEFIFIK